MTIYQRIRDLRVQHGLSQQQLANLTGYHDRSSIAKIESGFVDLPYSKILLFARVLSVSPAFLMGLNEDYTLDSVLTLSSHERDLIIAYRSHPEMQASLNLLLQIEPETVFSKNN